MLTGNKNSHMAQVFSRKDTNFVFDRNPVAFNQVLEFLRSDGEYRPKPEESKDLQTFLDELKYWGLEHSSEKRQLGDDRSLQD